MLAPSCTLPVIARGAQWGPAHTPPIHLFCQVQYISISGPHKHPDRGVCRGHYFGWLTWLSSGAALGGPLPLLPPHGGCIVEQALQYEEPSFLVVGSDLAQVMSS